MTPIPQTVAELELTTDEEVPVGNHSPELLGLLGYLGRKYSKTPDLDKELTNTARVLYYAPGWAVKIVTEELIDNPPKGNLTNEMLQQQVLTVIKMDDALWAFMDGRKERAERKQAQRRATNRRKRL